MCGTRRCGGKGTPAVRLLYAPAHAVQSLQAHHNPVQASPTPKEESLIDL